MTPRTTFHLESLHKCACGRSAVYRIVDNHNCLYDYVCTKCAHRRLLTLSRAHNPPTTETSPQ